ncbi:MAG: phosphatidate cytidylyltransferase [Gallionellaceae bacterium]|nr:phosphatidate cytidylyltransferase [Gallionellaceae bacterium]
MLRTRIITALILLLLFLLALFFLPPLGWAILVLGVIWQGSVEWAHLARFSANKWSKIYIGLTMAMMLAIAGMQYFLHSVMLHLIIYGLSALLWLVLVPLWLAFAVQVRQPLCMAVVGWLVLLPLGLSMLDMRTHNPYLLLGVMSLVWMADIAAYFAGRKFGKHKLAPTISPGKTWEGVVGALLGVSVYILLVAAASDLFAAHTVHSLLLVAWLGTACAVIGDLFESAIKRQAGVKDSGTLLPGHGGLLDRIDALTATLPLAALALLFHDLWLR